MKTMSDVSEPFLLITYTDLLGKAPKEVIKFMEQHYRLCRGVVASGNTNFGKSNYGKAADVLADMFGVDSLYKIDLRGSEADLHAVVKMYRERFSS